MSLSSRTLTSSLDVIEVKPGLKFSRQILTDLLPDVETTLFFGKVYSLDPQQLGDLLLTVHRTPLSEALFGEAGLHSSDLQDYFVELCDFMPDWDEGDINTSPDVPKGEILPELWKSLEVEIAKSIKDVIAKLDSVVNAMPGKQGQMLFKSLSVMNAKRPTIGDFRAKIHHAPEKQNLVVLDVSGSMSEGTVREIVDDVVAMSYMANAHMAIVSNTCTYWEPGTYSSDDILAAAEFGGTQYEQLVPLFDRDWGVVVTIADYDSSLSAKSTIKSEAKGHIDEVLDISLVNRASFLAECVGQLADNVRPLLVASSQSVIGSNSYY